IDRLPRLDRQRRPRRPGIVARHREAAADRARILLAQRQEAANVERAWRFAAALEGGIGTDYLERAAPGLFAFDMVAERAQPDRRFDQPAREFGPLHVAADPVEIGGGSRQHQGSDPSVASGSRMKLSLVPPPWLEFTTSEPLRRATRVRPPGTMVVPLAPVRTNGRKSTWRGATPCSVKVGTVDSASVGWAM